ncbi:MAG: DUF6263 family protein [Phycisphaerales bacterium]
MAAARIVTEPTSSTRGLVGLITLILITALMYLGLRTAFADTLIGGGGGMVVGAIDGHDAHGDDHDKVVFAPTFRVGREVVWEQTADSKGSQSFGDQEFPNDAYSALTMRVRTESVDENGVATITMTYDRVAMRGNAFFGGEYSYDSAMPMAVASPGVGPALTKLLDATITAKVAPDGKVSEVTGNEEAFEAMQAVAQLSGKAGEFSAQGLSQMIESFWLVGSPGQSFEEGDTWEESSDSDWQGMGTLTIATDYKMSEVTDEQARVDFQILISLDVEIPETNPEEDPFPILGVNLVSEENKGHLLYDLTAHELAFRESHLGFKLTTKQRGLFEGQEEMENVRTQSVTAILTRKEVVSPGAEPVAHHGAEDADDHHEDDHDDDGSHEDGDGDGDGDH